MKTPFNHILYLLLLFLSIILGISACDQTVDRGVISGPDHKGFTEAASKASALPMVVDLNVEELGSGKKRVSVTFSEAIDQTTVTSSSIGIYELTDNNTLASSAIAVTLSWPSPAVVDMDTTAALDVTDITNDWVLKVTQAVQDMAGDPLDGNSPTTLNDFLKSGSDFLVRLSSTSAPLLAYDLTRPILSFTQCLSGVIDTLISETTCPQIVVGAGEPRYYTVNFNKPMDASTINTTNISFDPALSGAWYVNDAGTAVAAGGAADTFSVFYFRPTGNLADGQRYTVTLNHDAIKGAAISGADALIYGYRMAYTSTDGVNDGPDNNQILSFYAAADPTTTPGPTVNGIAIDTDTYSSKVKIYFSTSDQNNNLMDTGTLIAGNVILQDNGSNYINFTSSTATKTLGGFQSTVWTLELADINEFPWRITITDGVKDTAGNKLNGDGDNIEDENDNYVDTFSITNDTPVILGQASVSPTTVTTGNTIDWDAYLIDYDGEFGSSLYTISIEIYLAGVLQSIIYNAVNSSFVGTTDYLNATYTVTNAAGSYTVRYTLGGVNVKEIGLTVQ